jgi:opacity protein-like surface antigen
MVSLKLFALAGAVTVGATAVASAADLRGPVPHLPPVPVAAPVAEASGWYLRGDIGLGYLNGNTETLQTGFPATRGVHESFNNTFYVGIGAGYQFNSWLRADVTGEFRGSAPFGYKDRFCYDAAANAAGGTGFCTPGGTPPSNNGSAGINSIRGNISSTAVLVNGYVDLGTWNGLTPFLGGGVGFAQHRIHGLQDVGSVESFNPGLAGPGNPTGFNGAATTLGTLRDKTQTNFAWALMAGVAYDVTPNYKVELGYRYLNLGDVTSGGSVCGVANCTTPTYFTRVKQIDSHEIRLGMRWMFGGPAYAAAPEYAPRVMKRF